MNEAPALPCSALPCPCLAIVARVLSMPLSLPCITPALPILNLALFDLEDIGLGSPELHAMEVFIQTTFHKHLVILAFIVAELAGGQIFPPSRARYSEPHSRSRVRTASDRGRNTQ